MAIDFLKAQKRQRYLMLILTLVVCAMLLVVWLGFFRKSASVVPISSNTFQQPKIEINWALLQNDALGELKTFEQVPVFKDEVGRKNPFTSY